MNWSGEPYNYYMADSGKVVDIPINPIGKWSAHLIKKAGGIPLTFSKPVHLELPKNSKSDSLVYQFQIKENQQFIAINGGWAFVVGVPSSGNEIYIVLRSNKTTAILIRIRPKPVSWQKAIRRCM